MKLEPSDRLQTIIDRPYSGPEAHAKAYAVLQRRHAEGRLPPVLDGTGDTLSDYVTILGIKT